ncbi:MAG: hypothetical protein AAF226_05410 [Verrucomicrobiota bacterium]
MVLQFTQPWYKRTPGRVLFYSVVLGILWYMGEMQGVQHSAPMMVIPIEAEFFAAHPVKDLPPELRALAN